MHSARRVVHLEPLAPERSSALGHAHVLTLENYNAWIDLALQKAENDEWVTCAR